MLTYEFIKSANKLIVGVGSALIDILANEGDAFIEKTGAAKGGMLYVENDFIDQALQKSQSAPEMVQGGSACNTVVGIGQLGGPARFVGKCGKGKMGDFFEAELRRQNVEPALFRSDSPTGRVLSIITPDAQRSMLTYLGASSEANPEDIDETLFKRAAVVHIEGYLLFNPELILAVLKAAKNSGAAVSLDLASYTVVEESRDFLKHIINDYVDILMGNEDEAQSYTAKADEIDAVKALSNSVDIAALLVGKRGSFIAHNENIFAVQAMGSGDAVDTTGAGDLWAAGFLYGLVNGYPLEKCGELASACGYEVCQVMGTKIPAEGWQRIRKLL
jgi:sugar/nucleoside kinase (ribokinase family)